MDQIEVIDTRGEVTFYKLDPEMGVSTIGRNPHAEILLAGAEVANIHAMLYHREAACQLVLYAENGTQTTLNSEPIAPNISSTLADGDTIQIGPYLLVYFKDGWDTASYPSEKSIAVVPLVVPDPTPPAAGKPNAALAKPTPATQPQHPWVTPRILEPAQVVRAGDKATFTLELTYELVGEAPPSATFEMTWLREKDVALNGVFKPETVQPITLNKGDKRVVDLTIDLARVAPGRYPLFVHISSKQIGKIARLEALLWVYPKDMADTASPANLKVQLMEPELTADTLQTVVYHALITNSGPSEAQCLITVEPVFPYRLNHSADDTEAKWHRGWDTKYDKTVNLHDGESRQIDIRLELAQARDMVAGVYPFKVIVRSSAYPRSSCMAVGRMAINSVMAFAVRDDELKTPMKVRYGRREATEIFVIHNTGNRPATFAVNAADRAGAVDFRFVDPNDPQDVARLAPVQYLIQPNTTKTLQMKAELREEARRFIAPEWRIHDVTLTTTMLTQPPFAPVQTHGQLWAKPFWLVWEAVAVLAAVAGVLMGIAVAVSWPTGRLHGAPSKTAINGEACEGQPSPIAMTAYSDTVHLCWSGSWFADWRWRTYAFETATETLVPFTRTLNTDLAAFRESPVFSTTYVITANNRLTQWLQTLPFASSPLSRTVVVSVTAVKPDVDVTPTWQINNFGASATLSWVIKSTAQAVGLEINGIREPLPDEQVKNCRALRWCELTIPFDKLTRNRNIVKFISTNPYLFEVPSVPAEILIKPRINKFLIEPSQVMVGQPFQVEWDVSSREPVSLYIGSNLQQPYRPVDALPPQPGVQTLIYTLVASGTSLSDSSAVTQPQTITVKAAPVPPIPSLSLAPNKTNIIKGTTVVITALVEVDANYYTETTILFSGPMIGEYLILTAKPPTSPLGATYVRVTHVQTVTADQNTFFLLTARTPPLDPVQVRKEFQVDPPPTPTPLPPTTDFFNATGPLGEQLTADPATADSINYVVLPGQHVLIKWGMSNAVKAKLNNVAGDQTPNGSVLVPGITRANSEWQITAINAANVEAIYPKKIRFRLLAASPPPVPFVSGVITETGLSLTWGQSTPDSATSVLTGYRVYRTPFGGVRELTGPPNIPTSQTSLYVPNAPDKPVCGYTYTVVVLFTNADNKPDEGQASIDSFNSGACPVPDENNTRPLAPTPEIVPIDSGPATPTPIP